MAECSAPHESADETGIYCELPEGHKGDHEAMMPITWRGMLAEGERKEQLAADLGTHADLADPVHGRDVFSRIEASTHE